MKPIASSLRTLALAALVAFPAAGTAFAAGGEHIHYKRYDWSYGGVTGQYDKAQLRRGFQVYKEVCAACHGVERLKFRNLVPARRTGNSTRRP